MKTSILILPNKGYAPLLARFVEPDEAYGRQHVLKAEAPMVEFYDTRYNHTDFGQFVSRYNLETLLNCKAKGGLPIDSAPAWYVNEIELSRVQQWLKDVAGAFIVAAAD